MPADERIALGDGDLWVTPERDDAGGPDEIVPGMGRHPSRRAGRAGRAAAASTWPSWAASCSTRRSAFGERQSASGTGACARSAGPATPTRWTASTSSSTPRPRSSTPAGWSSHPARSTRHMHWLSPQLGEAALAGGVTTLVAQDYGPIWNLGANPAACLRVAWAALEGSPLNVAFLVRASASRPEGVEESLAAGGAGPQDPRGRRRRARAAALRARRRRPPRRPARHPHRRPERGAARGGHRPRARRAGRRTCTTSRASAAATRPTSSALAGRERLLTSSTNPTRAVRGRRRGRAPGDGRRRPPARARARAPATPPSCGPACGHGRWRPRACCTTWA